ncbi:hypothetical protein HYG81_19620 (plasmid) [Natrinema zhouii]|uniref:hypothetical protein n=1 Tax=Natrinema zhouii TaxID=1710539 RepID=UPI001CFFEAB7|nr:hypothetical protein [Natrinema zhouii]UHQ98285.1 hypothetical protein HYG81_19620 [Natrinema zhouii]
MTVGDDPIDFGVELKRPAGLGPYVAFPRARHSQHPHTPRAGISHLPRRSRYFHSRSPQVRFQKGAELEGKYPSPFEYNAETAPIDVEATAKLDYAADPEQSLSIELEVPAGVANSVDLEDALSAVLIEARIAEE